MSSSEVSDSENTLKHSSLPRKSKHKYMVTYEYFMRWKNKRKEENLNEEVFLTYFAELAKVQKPSSLWAQYSMLKATMLAKHGVDMKNYWNLLSYLKKYTIGFKSEKTKILTEDDILKFVIEAPDEIHLATKVALIIGVGGACKIFELTDLTVNDIKMHGNLMLVRINSQVKKDRTFIVRDEFVPVVKKYQALRPKKMPTKRFFINYRAGECTRQVIGRNKLSSFPKQIASYLKLPNPERYTGHCFKRSWLASRTSLMTVEKPRVTDREANSSMRDEFGLLTTLVKRDREENSYVDIDINNEVDIKIEEMDTLEEEPLLRDDLLTKEFFNDLQALQAPGSGRSSSPEILDICDDTEDVSEDMDSVHIKDEEGHHVINLTTSQEEFQSANNPQETNIDVAGNNIRISFQNCARVGNITVNIISKQ